MIKKIALGLLAIALTGSCVSKKVYTDLENKYADLKKESRKVQDESDDCIKAKTELDLANATLKTDLEKAKSDRDKLSADYSAADKNLKTLQASYNALEKNSDDALESNMTKNRELLSQLEAKEKTLAAEQGRLDKLKNELQSSSQRLAELESMMAAKDASMKKLKETLSKALNSFEGKGLTVQQKTGKYMFQWRTNCCSTRGAGRSDQKDGGQLLK